MFYKKFCNYRARGVQLINNRLNTTQLGVPSYRFIPRLVTLENCTGEIQMIYNIFFGSCFLGSFGPKFVSDMTTDSVCKLLLQARWSLLFWPTRRTEAVCKPTAFVVTEPGFRCFTVQLTANEGGEKLREKLSIYIYGCNTQSRDGLEALTPFFSSCFSLRCFVQIIDTSEKRKTKENSTKKPFKDKGITFCNQKDTSIRLITNKSLRYYTVAYFDHFHCVHTFFFKFQIKYLRYFIIPLHAIYKYPSYI